MYPRGRRITQENIEDISSRYSRFKILKCPVTFGEGLYLWQASDSFWFIGKETGNTKDFRIATAEEVLLWKALCEENEAHFYTSESSEL